MNAAASSFSNGGWWPTCGAMFRASLLAFVVLAGNQPTIADQPPDPAAKPTAKTPLRLPASLPDGRPLRSIAIYESQMEVLIPDHYRPVSIDRFNEAVSRLADRATDDQASRLKGAVYWVEVVDDMLVSDRSVIDIESDRDVEVRRSLGQVNLAIEPPQSQGTVPAINVLPRLESESDGNLVAVFRGGAALSSAIEFKWRLRGQVSGTGHEFTMRLPRTPQTRIVLSAPPGVTIRSDDGVLRSRPGPPPDASQFVKNRDLRWYELEAGGLASVRIRTQKQRPALERGNFVVRRSSLLYEADPSGLNWTCRMVVQPAADQPFPPLSIRGTTITSVRVNATDVPFTSKVIGGRTRHLQIETPPGAVDPAAVSVNVTLTGFATWSARYGWCNLPMPMWMGRRVMHASAVDDVQLAVIDPLRIMSWQLPADWKQSAEEQVEEGITVYAAEGPPVALVSSADPVGARNSVPARGSWSRVRFADLPVLRSSDTALRLEVADSSLGAKARIAVKVARRAIEPIRLRVERGWSLDSVEFAHSGRVFENPSVNENTRVVVFWPEAEDAKDSEIVIAATGKRLLGGASAGLAIPSTWFLRPLGVYGDFVAAVVPPADLKWSGDAAMLRDRVTPSELSQAQQKFFNGLDAEALWFRPETGRTPSVSLQTPSVSFNSSTVFSIRRDRDELIEHLQVGIESEGQSLKDLVIQTGPAGGRPPLNWSISENSDSPSASLPASDVTLGEGASDGTYTIDVSDKNLRGRRLTARRRYPIDEQFELQLPSIPGAASQNSDVLISSGLLLKQKSRAVQLVPLTLKDPTSGNGLLGEGTHDRNAANQDEATLSRVTRGLKRLRYDAVQQPSITLVKSDVDPNVTIVWSEQVRVIASSRGADRIEATLRVSPTTPLQIEYDPDLQLASVARDGQAVDLITIEQRPIVLQPRSATEIIHIVWNRSQFGLRWMRRCRIPRIMVSGTILRSDYQLVSASDSFAPAALLRGRPAGSGRVSAVQMRPGENTLLIRRNVALAIGWLFALLVFALGWFVAQRAILVIAASVVVLATVLILWWPWKLAVIGWLVVPVVAAAMLAASRTWNDGGGSPDSGADNQEENGSSRRTRAEDLSADFSADALTRYLLLLLWVSASMTTFVAAQDVSNQNPITAPRSTRTVNVLVPVNESGGLYGEMIYIPGSVYAQLFPAADTTKPRRARFQSASYRMKIDPTGQDTEQNSGATIEAEYLIHVAGGNQGVNLVRLPLDFRFVRRIERMDDVSQIIKKNADSSGQVIAEFPSGSAFRIRATLLPQVSQSGQWTKLFLKIPPVASSRLTVESEQNIDALRVGGATGRTLPETDLRIWVEDLGPLDQLQIDYRTLASADSAASEPLQRRYWIHAGKKQVSIDCEVDPPTTVVAGEVFQFVVRDSAMPDVTSPAWRLDGSELYSPTRRLISLTSTRELPGPIRLLWTQPLVFSRDAMRSQPVRIPDVIAAALGETAPAWIALHADSSLQFAPPGRDTESLSVDHFLTKWSGYRGRIEIERAYVALGEIPSPVLERKSFTQPAVNQRHHLHVMPNRLELHYAATLTPSDSTSSQHMLRFPRSLELIRVSVDGQQLENRPIRSGDANEVLLGSPVGRKSVTINVVAVQKLPANGRFSPPRLALLPHAVTSDVYAISRDRSTMLRVIEPSPSEPLASEQVATADSLAKGWIPVSTWTIQSDQESPENPVPGGLYEVKVRPTRFDCRQLILLSRDDGRWNMETVLRFKSDQIPDFVDVEVPTRWCESLEVSAATAWSRQPATDPARQVIRIRCDAEELEGATLSLRGQLQSAETSRVSVPSVRVLGVGQRQIHVNVPSRLTGEPIQWRTSAVEAVKLPPAWRDRATETRRSTYLVANPSWSIDLAPLSEIDTDATAVSCDTQVFPNNSGALVICHWDLLPGSLERVDVRLPRGAICLGAWSAGQAVVAESVEPVGESGTDGDGDLLRVPLALSRLSQPVELMIRVPASTAKQASYLPELVDIPVTQKWLTSYVSADSISAASIDSGLPHRDRAFALARSVVEVVEAVDMVAQRPRDEIAAWLKLWLARYQMIAAGAGHAVDFESRLENLGEEDSTPLADVSEVAGRHFSPSHLQWNDLDSRLAFYIDRFLLRGSVDSGRPDSRSRPNDSESTDTNAFHFPVTGFEGFVPRSVTRLSIANRPRPVQPVSSKDLGLRMLMVNCLTLVLVAGLLLCLRPLRRFALPVVAHPAFWLALMGIFGFAVAPIPVAGALVLVAVSLPVFPSKRRSTRGPVS